MRRIKLVMGALMSTAALMASLPAVAQHYRYGSEPYHHQYYRSGRSDRDFVRGAIVGGVVTGLIYQANRPRPIYYSNGYAIDPTWIVTYRSSYDPYCGCNVIIRYYQDPYGNLHSYP